MASFLFHTDRNFHPIFRKQQQHLLQKVFQVSLSYVTRQQEGELIFKGLPSSMPIKSSPLYVPIALQNKGRCISGPEENNLNKNQSF
jgi:hypothetical protein